MSATKAAIAIDAWKLAIFTRRLDDAGFAFENAGKLTHDSLILKVETDDLAALAAVVKSANDEARREYNSDGTPKN